MHQDDVWFGCRIGTCPTLLALVCPHKGCIAETCGADEAKRRECRARAFQQAAPRETCRDSYPPVVSGGCHGVHSFRSSSDPVHSVTAARSRHRYSQPRWRAIGFPVRILIHCATFGPVHSPPLGGGCWSACKSSHCTDGVSSGAIP